MWLGTVILILIIGSGDPGESEMLVRQARFETYEACMRTTRSSGPEIFDRNDLDADVNMEEDTVHVMGFCLPSLEAEKDLKNGLKKGQPTAPSEKAPSGVGNPERYQRYEI